MWMGGNFDRRTPSEHLLVAIVEALYRNGHTVHIIQKDTGGDLPKLPVPLQKLGVTTDCIPTKLADKGNFIARYIVELKYVWRSRKFLKKHRDSGAVFNQSSNVAGFMAFFVKRIMPRARLTYNVQDIFPENAAYTGSAKGIVYQVLSAEQRYAYRHADQIITISEDMKDLLVEKGADADKTHVLYNWSYQDEPYDPEKMENSTIRRMFPRDKFNVVYAGNIGVMQNVDVVVDAARLMQEDSVQFHIIGDGVYKEKLIQKAEGLENIRFWPMQPSSLAPNIYSMADINVIPLAENIYRTALPSKTATCLACQKPIIFCFGEQSKFGTWMNEVAECPTIGSKDAAALVQKILDIRSKGQNGRTGSVFVQYFSRSTNSGAYADLIVPKETKQQ